MELIIYKPYVSNMIVVLFMILQCVAARRFAEEGYYPSNYYESQQERYAKINTALGKLDHAPQWVNNWPDPSVKLGQVSGVALDSAGRVFVYHRGSNVWDAGTFTSRNVYQAIGDPPISTDTILVFNETGELVDSWGSNLFYMPHGITVDGGGNVWLTDVALHQVFKFTPDQRQVPAMVLGEKFVPGNDDAHYCKPSAVAVHSSGDFFVADGYCNTRIIKYAPDGTRILQWGRRFGESPFVLNVPHALTLAEDRGALCAADRERGRVACFRADNGSFVASYSSWLVGQRLFSVAYAPVHGGRLYIVNGPSTGVPVRGYVVDYASGRLLQTFAPGAPGEVFSNPHDIAVSADGGALYVAELDPYKVYKFTDEALRNESREVRVDVTHAKPTATVEANGVSASPDAEVGQVGQAGQAGRRAADGGAWGALGGWGAWGGAAGGAAAALGAAGLALAALALLRARNRGRKSVTRRWEYGRGEFKLRRLLERRRFTRVHSDDSDDEPAPMLPPHPHPPANA